MSMWQRFTFFALALTFASVSAQAAISTTRLRCDNAENPLGIDIAAPRLSWHIASDAPAALSERGQVQTAFQILVASTPDLLAENRGDLWDSGRIMSDTTLLVPYAGKALSSSQHVHWKVRAWDREGHASPWSEPAAWTMGLLTVADWGNAQWIGAPWPSESFLLRRDFTVSNDDKRQLARALLHISGLGTYEVSINGEKHGDDLLSPGWTNYNKTTLYDTRDITALVKRGANTLGITLGNGMYNVIRRERFSKFVGSFGALRAIALLRLEYTDGTSETIGTDASWHAHRGPVTFNSIYGGEDYDARLNPSGWNRPGYDASAWEPATISHADNVSKATLRNHSYAAEPLAPIKTHRPVSVRTLSPSVQLYDFGQNASFMPRIRVTGPASSTVRLTAGEIVNADGTINRGTMGGAHRGSAWWQYTKATDGEESWFPQFYYIGSRYIYAELKPASEGENAKLPAIASLEAVVVHSVAEPTGDFSCSNPLLNRIRDLVRWAQRSNMVSILTDCPHREKLGWIEQYHLNGPSIRYEFDTTRIYAKGMHDMAAAQTDEGLIPNITPEYTTFKGTFRAAAEWGTAFILVPWQHYLFTGDVEPMREHYAAMTRYYAYLETRLDENGFLAEGLGDWYDLLLPKLGRANLTPARITATAFLYEDARTLSHIAALLGHADDAQIYSRKADEIRARYNTTFYHADKGDYATRTQCSNALPFVMGIVAPANRAQVLSAIVADVEQKGYATAGDVGFRYLLQALAQGGRSDVIYRMINQDEKPGYGYQLAHGCTALAESWYAGHGASQNHFMLGQITEWFYKDLVGIDTDPAAPGFKNIIIRPNPVGDLTWAQASYRSPHGKIFVRWERDVTAHVFTLRVQIPANTTASIWIPCEEKAPIQEGGKPANQQPGVLFNGREAGRSCYNVASGNYVFTSTF